MYVTFTHGTQILGIELDLVFIYEILPMLVVVLIVMSEIEQNQNLKVLLSKIVFNV